MNVKLAVVIRRDLEMSCGLVAAQACHINDEWLRSRVLKGKDSRSMKGEGRVVNFESSEFQWLGGPEIAILAVNIPEELDVLIKRAKDVGVACHIWKDTIPSKIFAGQFLEVVVGISVGPDDDEKVKQITGTLPLF